MAESAILEADRGVRPVRRTRYGRVLLFLALTFGLTWGFELLVELTIGQAAYLETGLNPMGMYFPAFSAIFLEMFVFKDSAIHFRTHKGETRWVLYGFLLLTALNGVVTALALTTDVRPLILQGVGAILVMQWTLLVFYVYGRSGEEGFGRVGLQLGNKDLGIRFIAGVVVFLLSQAALNWLLGLGDFVGVREEVAGVPVSGLLYPLALVVFFLISVVGTPLAGLATVFGEEYGWRGFLQNELVRLGRRPGVLLVGIIWGVWHFPIILSGIHTYPPTPTGLALGLVFFVLVGFVFGYAVMKTKSLWIAAFLHGVLNSIYSFVGRYLVHPRDNVLSFGLGVYGLVCLLVIVLAILRDPVWSCDRQGTGETRTVARQR
jgi:membrane protease YdiL (CAAX protease family)